MKKFTLLLFVILLYISAFAQVKWETQEVGNGLYVDFPIHATYSLKEGKGIYISKTENCIFSVIVQYDAIPYYDKFLKLPVDKKDKLRSIFLDNVIKGKLEYVNNLENQPTSIKIGDYQGRQIVYSAVNPITGSRDSRFSKVFLINNKLYSFECMSLKESNTSEEEKNQFLNSITLN